MISIEKMGIMRSAAVPKQRVVQANAVPDGETERISVEEFRLNFFMFVLVFADLGSGLVL